MILIPLSAGGPSLTAYVLRGAWLRFRRALPRTARAISATARIALIVAFGIAAGIAVTFGSLWGRSEGYNFFALFNEQPFAVEDTTYYRSCEAGIEMRRATHAATAAMFDALVLHASKTERAEFLALVPDLGPETREAEEARCRRLAIREWAL